MANPEIHFTDIGGGAPAASEGADGDWAFGGDGKIYYKVSGAWQARAVAGLTVPQAHEGAVSAPAAVTGATVTTVNATDLATAEALANASKTAINANVADIANLHTTQAALVTALNALLTALASAGILS